MRLALIFQDGPHPIENDFLDIIIADAEGMFFSFGVLQLYLTGSPGPVLEMSHSLDDPYGAYKRKVKKGAYHVAILYMLIFPN